MTVTKTIQINDFQVQRVENYGFRSNTPYVEWHVHKEQHLIHVFNKLKWAKEYISKGDAEDMYQYIVNSIRINQPQPETI